MTTPMNIANKKRLILYIGNTKWYIRLPFNRSFCNLKNTSNGEGKVSILKVDEIINQNMSSKIKDKCLIN